MYFLETIEGSAGERLTSAVLKYLFINSGEFRRLFLKQIERDFAASEIPSFKNGVICFDEYPADDGKGFIDLVVIADNAALGIENKLWAGLTDDQPSKYLPTLEGLARERCGTGGAFRIVMLVPEQRQDEIHRELQRQNISGGASVLFWQLVMKDLNTLAQEETGEVAAVANVFHEYLSSRINDVKINADPTKLLGGVKLGNSFQHDFLKKVREVFANAGRIQAGGKDAYRWYGFYFEFSRQDGKTWVRPGSALSSDARVYGLWSRQNGPLSRFRTPDSRDRKSFQRRMTIGWRWLSIAQMIPFHVGERDYNQCSMSFGDNLKPRRQNDHAPPARAARTQ